VVIKLDKTQVTIEFSNGEKINLNKDSIIFPIKLTEHNGEKFSSKPKPIVLEDWFHSHDGFIPELTTTFSLNEFFTIGSDVSYDIKIYKTSAIVSMYQTD
jgi:hypothetical protein